MALQLRDSAAESSITSRVGKLLRKGYRRAIRSCMKSHRLRLPKYDFPLRIRPWFLLFTSLIMVVLAFLGFTNFVRRLPLNDKILHFICLAFATGVFYFIWDVDEDARRIWIWRNAGAILTGVICFFFGGIVSEIVQSMLPYKVFEMGDIIANLLGSSLGLWVSYHLERYYRHRREISRLYQPVSAEEEEELFSDSDAEDTYQTSGPARGLPLLPTHHPIKPSGQKSQNQMRMANVWDESEELFGIGDDEMDDLVRPSTETVRAGTMPSVKVFVTPPS